MTVRPRDVDWTSSMSSNPAGSYALMLQYYKKSNEYLAKALEIDESGQGWMKV